MKAETNLQKVFGIILDKNRQARLNDKKKNSRTTQQDLSLLSFSDSSVGRAEPLESSLDPPAFITPCVCMHVAKKRRGRKDRKRKAEGGEESSEVTAKDDTQEAREEDRHEQSRPLSLFLSFFLLERGGQRKKKALVIVRETTTGNRVVSSTEEQTRRERRDASEESIQRTSRLCSGNSLERYTEIEQELGRWIVFEKKKRESLGDQADETCVCLVSFQRYLGERVERATKEGEESVPASQRRHLLLCQSFLLSFLLLSLLRIFCVFSSWR